MRNACKAAINLYYRKLLLAVPWGFFSGCVAKSFGSDPSVAALATKVTKQL